MCDYIQISNIEYIETVVVITKWKNDQSNLSVRQTADQFVKKSSFSLHNKKAQQPVVFGVSSGKHNADFLNQRITHFE